MNKELAIGEIGVIDGVRVRCVEDKDLLEGCTSCAFYEYPDFLCAGEHKCVGHLRSDHTDVYFKKIEE